MKIQHHYSLTNAFQWFFLDKAYCKVDFKHKISRSHTISDQSLLLSTIVLNDTHICCKSKLIPRGSSTSCCQDTPYNCYTHTCCSGVLSIRGSSFIAVMEYPTTIILRYVVMDMEFFCKAIIQLAAVENLTILTLIFVVVAV